MKIFSTLPNVQDRPLTQDLAARTLRMMAARLQDSATGKIQSGYLKLTDRRALNAGGFFTSGSHARATQTVRNLVHQAYGERLGPERQALLDRAMDTYLGKTGGAIGTRSFVKLVRTLEHVLPGDDGQSPRPQSPGVSGSRLDLKDLLTASAPKDGKVGAETAPALAQQAGQTVASRGARQVGPQAQAAGSPAQAQPGVQTEPLSTEEVNEQIAQLKTLRGSPISDSALQQFQTLRQEFKAAPQYFMAFSQVMFPSASRLNPVSAAQGPDAPRTFVMGDADGSMGRMVLHAMASGVAELPPEQMPALARLMQKEAQALEPGGGGMRTYQRDAQVSEDLDQIAAALIVKPKTQDGKPACIFLGDILSDRFTNNQEAMSKFIYKLSGLDPENPSQARVDTGVRFIAGNHDTQPLLDGANREVFRRYLYRFDSKGQPLRNAGGAPIYNVNKRELASAEQWGAFATKKLSMENYRDLLLNCFKAADYSDGVLTTHNGVAGGSAPGEYLVGSGHPEGRGMHRTGGGRTVKDSTRLTASGPEELAHKMNLAFFDRVKLYGGEDAISTDFRPEDLDMTPSALGLSHIPGFRQLHGHNDEHNESHDGVTNLNARGDGEGLGHGFMPVGTVIEYAPVQAAPPLLRV